MKDKFFVSVKWCSSINFFIEFKPGRSHQIIYSDPVYHRSLHFIFNCTRLSSLCLTYYTKTSSVDLKAERWRIKRCPWLFALKVKYLCCCEIVPYSSFEFFWLQLPVSSYYKTFFFCQLKQSFNSLYIFLLLIYQIISKSLLLPQKAIQNKLDFCSCLFIKLFLLL